MAAGFPVGAPDPMTAANCLLLTWFARDRVSCLKYSVAALRTVALSSWANFSGLEEQPESPRKRIDIPISRLSRCIGSSTFHSRKTPDQQAEIVAAVVLPTKRVSLSAWEWVKEVAPTSRTEGP